MSILEDPRRGGSLERRGACHLVGIAVAALVGGACTDAASVTREPSGGGEAGAPDAAGADAGGADSGGEAGATEAAGGAAGGASGATSSGGAGGASPALVLCDGSEEIRLAVVSGGGMVSPPDLYVNPYGFSSLFVDGRCRYWMSIDSGELREGALSAAQASALEAATAYDHLADLEGTDLGCPDAGATTILGPEHQASCSCGCDTAEKEAVFSATGALTEALWAAATAEDSALFAMWTQDVWSSTEVEWPLSWPYTALEELTYANAEQSGTAITSAEDRAALRAMRAEVLATEPDAKLCRLAGTPEPVSIALREKLPAEVDAAVEAFLAGRQR